MARVTRAIIVSTAIAHLVAVLGGSLFHDWLAVAAGIVPARLSGLVYLPSPFPAWLTPISSLFVHDSIMHLGLNMLMLFVSARLVELVLGPVRTLIVYVVGAYAAALAQVLADPASSIPIIGASGAVSALIGTYALLFGERRAAGGRILSEHAATALWLAASWIGLQLLIGLVLNTESGGGVAIWAHVGGFLAGLALARPLALSRFGKLRD